MSTTTSARERTPIVALAALLLILVTCALSVAGTLSLRTGAVRDLAEARETLSNLELHARGRTGSHPAATTRAPAAAYLEAPTEGIAGARLQAYVSELVAAARGALISAGTQPAARDDGTDSLRLIATVEISTSDLQILLYRLETATPYVFVDGLSIQIAAARAQRGDEPTLRVSLGVRSLWRRVQG